MDILHIEHPITFSKELTSVPLSVAFGNFDGLHAGHQEVIAKAIQLAKAHSYQSGVMTFHPHPKEVLGIIDRVTYLTPLEDKLKLLAELGLDKVFIIHFTQQFARLKAEEFIQQYIVNLQVKQVVTGFDFCFGYKGEGNTTTLEEWSRKKQDFQVHVTPSIDDQNEKISSSRIRKLLKLGKMEEVNRLLRREYSVRGSVVDGQKLGRRIGFPTANLKLHHPYALPKIGVYAVRVTVKGKVFQGVLNLGFKPTFHLQEEEPVLEVHILDFNQEIYHEELTVHFVSYLREERKFSSIEELKAQIERDITLAKQKLI